LVQSLINAIGNSRLKLFAVYPSRPFAEPSPWLEIGSTAQELAQASDWGQKSFPILRNSLHTGMSGDEAQSAKIKV